MEQKDNFEVFEPLEATVCHSETRIWKQMRKIEKARLFHIHESQKGILIMSAVRSRLGADAVIFSYQINTDNCYYSVKIINQMQRSQIGANMSEISIKGI